MLYILPAQFYCEKVCSKLSENGETKISYTEQIWCLVSSAYIAEAGGTPSRHNSFRTFAEMKGYTCILVCMHNPHQFRRESKIKRQAYLRIEL